MSGVCGKGKRHKMSTTNDNMHVEQTLSAPIQVVEAAPTKKRGRPPKDKVPQDRTHSSQAVPSQMTLSVAGNSQSATHIVFQTPCSTAEATTSFKRVPNEFAVAGSSRTISPSPKRGKMASWCLKTLRCSMWLKVIIFFYCGGMTNL